MSVASAQDDRSAEWNRLLMKAESISDRFDTNITFKESSVNTLNWNKPEDTTTPESIGDEIRATLPKVQDVFSIEFVLRPSFPILMLKRVADFYGCLIIPEDIVRLLDDESLRSREAMLYAWLGYLMNPSLDGVTRMLDLYWTVQYPTGANSLQETPVSRPAAAPASILVQSPTRHNNNTNVIDVTTNTAMMPHGSTPTHQPRTSSGPTESVAHRRNERAQTITQVQDGSGTTSFSIEDVNPPTVQRNNNLGDVRAHFQSGNDSHKKASSVSAHFRDSHFTGSKEQSIHRTIRDFNVCARQYELSTDQKRMFFVNAFAGSARDYFFDNCRDDMSFDELVKVMVNEFDSDARQLAVHSELDRITIERVMADNDITEMDTELTVLVEKINTLTPQCPPHFRSDTNKTRFLRNAVIRQEWARPAISQITTSRYTFNGLVTALREQLQLCEEQKEISKPIRTLYQRYGRSPRYISRNGRGTNEDKPFTVKNPFDKDGKRLRCRLCHSEDHFANKCPQGSYKKSVQDKLRTGIPSIHILSELVTHLDSTSMNGDDQVSNDCAHGESELDTFNVLVYGNNEEPDRVTVSDESYLTQTADMANATHHIATQMENWEEYSYSEERNGAGNTYF